MIYDNLKNKETYKGLDAIDIVLQWISSMDTVPEATVELRGRDVFINPVSLVSKPEEECVFEAHREYIDVHYILSGTEGIAVRDVSALTPREAFDIDKDIGFYTGEARSVTYLYPGDFMVCCPQDAHMVAMMKDAPCEIKKLVAKIRVELM